MFDTVPTTPRSEQSEQGDPLQQATLSDQQLEDELCSQAAHLAVAECHLVLLIAEFDRRAAWAGSGLRSCAHWLNWRCGVALGAAREQVRVGRALVGLPVVRHAFSSGQLSYSKVRAITRVATANLEQSLVEIARYTSASQLEQLVRDYRHADPDEGPAALARHGRRFVRSHTDDDGMVVIHARLAPEDGAVVLAAIEAARRALAGASGVSGVSAETLPAAPEVIDRPEAVARSFRPKSAHSPCEGPGDEYEVSHADALITVCESVLDGGLRGTKIGPGAIVVVHVDEAVLDDPREDGCCSVERAGALAAHTAGRLACDAAISRVVHQDDGRVEPEGRTRSIPSRMRRGVLARDRGCRFPGCPQRAFLDVHHVVFWTKGGRTTPDNLVCLCRHHHRLVHEGGYRVELEASGGVLAWTPEGRALPTTPASLVPLGPDLVTQHQRAGSSIDAATLSYCGEPFDRSMVIDRLLWDAGKLVC